LKGKSITLLTDLKIVETKAKLIFYDDAKDNRSMKGDHELLREAVKFRESSRHFMAGFVR
jgi:hypothetical protein